MIGDIHPADLTICRLILNHVLDPLGVQYAVRRHLERLRGLPCTPKPFRGPMTLHCPTPVADWARGSRVTWTK